MKFLFFLPIILVLSNCKRDDVQIPEQDCGIETKAELIIHNYSEFSNFTNKVVVGDVQYYSHYYFSSTESLLGTFLWGFQIRLSNLCVQEKPKVELSVFLHKPDSMMIPESTIFQGKYFIEIKPLTTNDSILYRDVVDYHFIIDTSELTGYLTSTIIFPMTSKGSFSADSAYFFSNLDYMSIKVTAHKPK